MKQKRMTVKQAITWFETYPKDREAIKVLSDEVDRLRKKLAEKDKRIAKLEASEYRLNCEKSSMVSQDDCRNLIEKRILLAKADAMDEAASYLIEYGVYEEDSEQVQHFKGEAVLLSRQAQGEK